MTLPETIPVRYTEEEAEYLSIRPVVRQTFRFNELVDMVMGVTGKDAARIGQILRSGTIVYRGYRYWWPGFEASAEDMDKVLAQFPESDPSRPFQPESCTVVVLESGGRPPRHAIELTREVASRKRLFRPKSLWDCILALARDTKPVYAGYSYVHRADLYHLPLEPRGIAALTRASRASKRDVRALHNRLPEMTQMIFVCPRSG